LSGKYDSFAGANGCARTAFDAGIGIDIVLNIALGDSLNGTFGQTGAAAYTLVSDYVSHD